MGQGHKLKELGYEIVNLKDGETQNKAKIAPSMLHLDGGDVLFTGKMFIVGVSSRTTVHGINALRNIVG